MIVTTFTCPARWKVPISTIGRDGTRLVPTQLLTDPESLEVEGLTASSLFKACGKWYEEDNINSVVTGSGNGVGAEKLISYFYKM